MTLLTLVLSEGVLVGCHFLLSFFPNIVFYIISLCFIWIFWDTIEQLPYCNAVNLFGGHIYQIVLHLHNTFPSRPNVCDGNILPHIVYSYVYSECWVYKVFGVIFFFNPNFLSYHNLTNTYIFTQVLQLCPLLNGFTYGLLFLLSKVVLLR